MNKMSLLSAKKQEVLARVVAEVRHLPGELAEFGVFRGGSAKIIASVCPHKKLHLYDTFAGFPQDEMRGVGIDFPKGALAYPLDKVKDYLAGCDVEYHVGEFPYTCDPDLRFCFAHIDADTYMGTMQACWYFLPRTSGALVFDDYPSEPVVKAMDYFFKPEQILRTPGENNCVVYLEGFHADRKRKFSKCLV